MPRLSLAGSLVAVAVASAALTTGYAGCFLPDYAKDGDEAASSGSPGATTGNPGSGGAGGVGGGGVGADGGASSNGGGPPIQCEVPDEAPSDGACVMLTTTSAGAGGGGGAGGGAGGAGGAGAAGGGGPAINIACNPVTNEPCEAGNACDVAATMDDGVVGFSCYPDNNVAELCEACDASGSDPTFCVGGLTCIENQCVRYCCTDADCGEDGKCEPLGYGITPELGGCVLR